MLNCVGHDAILSNERIGVGEQTVRQSKVVVRPLHSAALASEYTQLKKWQNQRENGKRWRLRAFKG
jgi:hypothetical protein